MHLHPVRRAAFGLAGGKCRAPPTRCANARRWACVAVVGFDDGLVTGCRARLGRRLHPCAATRWVRAGARIGVGDNRPAIRRHFVVGKGGAAQPGQGGGYSQDGKGLTHDNLLVFRRLWAGLNAPSGVENAVLCVLLCGCFFFVFFVFFLCFVFFVVFL